MTANDSSNAINWFDELAANASWISRVIYARTQDWHAVEEVQQELAAAAISWPVSLCGPSAVNRWLYSVAVKQTFQFRRKQRRETGKTERLAKHLSLAEPQSSDPMEHLIVSENVKWLREAMDRLPPRQRDVLHLKHLEGWTCRQIAEKFELAESTVKRHLVNAKQRLRAELLKQKVNDE